ncbi:MAG: Gfo/Idh/MocA family oxidoreductase [Planctomycetota bacterium]|nr:Gfo/Idh/MocA family oxidoreductase [Planctomycetota bacterium]
MSSATQPVAGRPTKLALIGSGFIADVHLQVLKSVRDVEVVALCDVAVERAEQLAKQHGVPRTFASIDELAGGCEVDAVHLLVPPGLHKDLAAQCLERGWHTLVEKPLVLRSEEVAALQELALARGVVLAVNHNQTWHPAIKHLEGHVAAGRFGRLEHLTVQHHVPLRQLQTGDVGHFMFRTEANIVWEQGVHLFSMVYALLGPCRDVQVITGARRELPNGVRFVEEWVARLECARGAATVRMAFGKPWLETTVQAIGTDGAALLDLARGSCWLRRKTRWLDFLDGARNLASGAKHLTGRAFGALFGYALGLFKVRFPDDPFLRSMRSALDAFHRAARGDELPAAMTPAGAEDVLKMCEQVAAAAGARLDPPPAPAALPAPGAARPGEVVVLGGTGLIGRRCVRVLRKAKRPVTMLVRKPDLLPPELRDGSVRVFVGDAADPTALAQAFQGAERVLHLATAAGPDPAKMERAMADAVRAAGEAARDASVRRFVYASSTAALWLGDAGTVDGAAGTDPQPTARPAYSRGKIASEQALAELGAQGREVTVLRPAIVVAYDGIFEHSGVGLWVRDNHCVGWGLGKHPLPFVLASDCAQAFVAALDAPNAGGKAYNLAGDVALSARDYVEAMAARTGRDYHFHPTPLWWMWSQEFGKYVVKKLARKAGDWPAYRDFASRSFTTQLDSGDAKMDLGFTPESDRGRFLSRIFDERR